MIRGPSRRSWELGCGVFLFDAKLQGHFEAHTAIAHSGCRGNESTIEQNGNPESIPERGSMFQWNEMCALARAKLPPLDRRLPAPETRPYSPSALSTGRITMAMRIQIGKWRNHTATPVESLLTSSTR